MHEMALIYDFSRAARAATQKYSDVAEKGTVAQGAGRKFSPATRPTLALSLQVRNRGGTIAIVAISPIHCVDMYVKLVFYAHTRTIWKMLKLNVIKIILN